MNSTKDPGNKRLFIIALRNLIAEILVFILLLIAVFQWVVGVTVQRGNDMYPFLMDGDIILYYRHADLLPSEAVVYETSGGHIRTGRIAAAGGSEIGAAGDGQLTVDGALLAVDEEHGICNKTYVPDDPRPAVVSNGSYYILNDKRDRMDDSRTYGEISSRNILGRIISVLRVRTI